MADCAQQVKTMTEALENEHRLRVEAEARVLSLEKLVNEQDRVAEQLRDSVEKERAQASLALLHEVHDQRCGLRHVLFCVLLVSLVLVPGATSKPRTPHPAMGPLLKRLYPRS